MNQVITNKNILNQIALLIELNLQTFSTNALNYCKTLRENPNYKCTYVYSDQGIINKAEIDEFQIFGFSYNELQQALDNPEKIKRIRAYQELRTCAEHYEELLEKICTDEGWKIKVPDKQQEYNLEGIFDDSLVFAPHRAKEPRVFTVRQGLVTTLDNTPEDSIGSFLLVRNEEEQKAFEKDIDLDKVIIKAFTEAYNLKNIYEGVNGAVRPS